MILIVLHTVFAQYFCTAHQTDLDPLTINMLSRTVSVQ